MANDHMDALPSGHRIREYEIRRVLGRGGFGITYLAHDTLLDRDVAVKEYLPTDCAVRTEDYSVRPRSSETSKVYTWGLERFLDEARMMACLDHPSIVGVHTYVELNGTGYIVMEYIEGEPLYDRLKRQGKLDPFDFRLSLTAILKPLVGGLEQVHSGGYLHRDITPRNIMLKEDGTPVLTDFGSARQMVAARSRSVTAVVTPGYATLEQYSTHGKQGPWTDIYALSAVAYRCITGTVPLDATERVQADELMLASEIGRWGYPVGLLTAVDMGLSLKSEDRPQDLTAWREVWCKPSAGAAEWYRRAAERGRPSAQWYLGDMHATGRWAAQDDVEAVTWFRKAAEQGHILAQTHLWGMYSRGRGVAQDDVAAVKWCRLAANQGDAFAQCALGVMHEKGRGVAEDDAEAVNWYRRAAEQGHGRAQFYLGVMYLEGRGIHGAFNPVDEDDATRDAEWKQDVEEASRWFELAAESGITSAQWYMGDIEDRPARNNFDNALMWRRKERGAMSSLRTMKKRWNGIEEPQNRETRTRNMRLERRTANSIRTCPTSRSDPFRGNPCRTLPSCSPGEWALLAMADGSGSGRSGSSASARHRNVPRGERQETRPLPSLHVPRCPTGRTRPATFPTTSRPCGATPAPDRSCPGPDRPW